MSRATSAHERAFGDFIDLRVWDLVDIGKRMRRSKERVLRRLKDLGDAFDAGGPPCPLSDASLPPGIDFARHARADAPPFRGRFDTAGPIPAMRRCAASESVGGIAFHAQSVRHLRC